MGNEENIKNYKFSDMSAERQREIASMGGKACQANKKRRKTLREELEIMLEILTKDKDGKDATYQDVITTALLTKASKGDVKAYEVIRDTIGEKPVEEKNVVITAPLSSRIEIVDEMKKHFANEEDK